MIDTTGMTLADVARLVARREIHAEEVIYRALIAVEDNDALNALIYVDREGALRRAREIDLALDRHESVGPLAGVPIVLKDNICRKDMPLTCASAMLADYVAPYDATVAERLDAAGAILLGKANMDEFAMGSASDTGFFGEVRNPYDVGRTAGGSSGGCAVAVATGQCFAALGTDTGGSVRQPAAFCGVVGFKPSYGVVSRYGVVAHASSLDQVGPIARTVGDCALVLDAIAGSDPRDASMSRAEKPDYTALDPSALRGAHVGFVTQMFASLTDPDVKAAMQRATALLTGLGAELVPVSLPSTDYAVAAYCVLADAEAASNLARFDGVRYGFRADGATDEEIAVNSRTLGFGAEVKRRILLGNYVLSAGNRAKFYDTAQRARAALRAEYEKAFSVCDFLMTPTAPTPAFALGSTDDVVGRRMCDVCTVSANLAGLPAISLPVGANGDGLPIGLQLTANRFCDRNLLSAAAVVEGALRG